MKQRKKLLLRFGIILVIMILVGVFEYAYMISPQTGWLQWDEAHHSLFGRVIYQSLRSGRLDLFWQWSNQQIYWPFLHSWGLGVSYFILGVSDLSGRLASVGFYLLAIPLIYLLANRLSNRKHSCTAGFLAIALLIGSPIYLFTSATIMIEPQGCFLTLIILLFMFKGLNTDHKLDYLWAGVMLGLLLLSKYVFAEFIGFGIFLFYLSLGITLIWKIRGRIIERKEKALLIRGIYLLLGFLSICLIWVISPPTLPKATIIWSRINESGGWNLLELALSERILYSVRCLLCAYTYSFWVFLLLIGGLIWGVFNYKNLKVRLLLFIFLAGYIPMSIITNKQDRFIYIVAPSLFIMTAIFVEDMLLKIPRNIMFFLIPIVCLLIAADLHKFPRYIRVTGNYTGSPAFKEMYDLDYSILGGVLEYPDWLQQPAYYLNPDAERTTTQHNMKDIVKFIKETITGRGGLCFNGLMAELSPHLLNWISEEMRVPIYNRWEPRSRFYMTVLLSLDSPYLTTVNRQYIETNGRWAGLIEQLEKAGELNLFQSKNFPDIGVKVNIYERVNPKSLMYRRRLQ